MKLLCNGCDVGGFGLWRTVTKKSNRKRVGVLYSQRWPKTEISALVHLDTVFPHSWSELMHTKKVMIERTTVSWQHTVGDYISIPTGLHLFPYSLFFRLIKSSIYCLRVIANARVICISLQLSYPVFLS